MLYHSILRRPAQDAPAGSGEGKENAALPEKTDKTAKCGGNISKLTKWEEHGIFALPVRTVRLSTSLQRGCAMW